MKTEMQKLRAAMMTGGTFTGRERRAIKYLSPGNQAQRETVMDALPRKDFIRGRMTACGEADSWGNINYCGVPLCPRCHMHERGKQTGQAIQTFFADACNEELSFATILLPVQKDFRGMTKLFEMEKRRLRTFIDRKRKQDERWNDFQLVGWLEIDRMSFGDYEAAGRNTRMALDDLGIPLSAASTDTIWRPHLHAIIHRGRLTVDEIRQALRKETHTGRYQVDIQPFRTNRSVAENLKNVIRYALKFRIETDYKKPEALDFIEQESTAEVTRNWWPANDIAAYVNWLVSERSGFQSLRVVIGKGKAITDMNPAIAVVSDVTTMEKAGDGCLSTKTMSDREDNLRHDVDVQFRSSGTFNVDDFVREDECDRVESGTGSGADVMSSFLRNWVRSSVYNNIVHDTNWMPNDGLDDGGNLHAAAELASAGRSAKRIVGIDG